MQSAWKNIQRLEVQLQIQGKRFRKEGADRLILTQVLQGLSVNMTAVGENGWILSFIISTRGPQERSWVVYITEYCRCHKQHQEPDVPHPWSCSLTKPPLYFYLMCASHSKEPKPHMAEGNKTRSESNKRHMDTSAQPTALVTKAVSNPC